MAFLPLPPEAKARVNNYLAGMAARGFGVTETMLRQVCRLTDDEWKAREIVEIRMRLAPPVGQKAPIVMTGYTK